MKIRPFKPFLLSWLPALAGMGVLFYTSSLRGDQVHLPPFPYSDKAVHFSAYCILGLLISLRKTLRGRISGTAGGHAAAFDIRGWAVGAVYGFADEVHQLFVPLRSYDYADMAADAAGAAFGCWIFARFAARR